MYRQLKNDINAVYINLYTHGPNISTNSLNVSFYKFVEVRIEHKTNTNEKFQVMRQSSPIEIIKCMCKNNGGLDGNWVNNIR